MSIFGGRKESSPLKQEREQHKQYQFLAHNGIMRLWVHCPICGSINDGWTEDGRARYSGGTIQIELGGYVYLAACICEQGKWQQSRGVLSIMESMGDDNMQFLQSPMAIVWTRGDRQSIPSDLEDAPIDLIMEMIELTNARLSDKISRDEFQIRHAELKKQIPTSGSIPTMAQVLGNDHMRALYCNKIPPVERLPYKD